MIFEGVVVAGRRLGRELGFPTANILVDESASVASGVYRSIVSVEGVSYWAVSNLGVNPTVGAVERRLESYLLDFDGDLYTKRIRVELKERLRDEMHFESLEALKRQIQCDIDVVRGFIL